MRIARSSIAFALVFASSLVASGCFALFSLDDYGPGGGPSDAGDSGEDAPAHDGGDGDAADAARQARTVFVTRGRFTGSMGGLTGADGRCNAAAQDAGLPGSYLAWLGAAGAGPAARLPDPSRPIILANGTEIAGSLGELADAGPRMPITLDERRQSVAAAPCSDDHVWTNARPNGDIVDGGGFDCDSWSATNGGGGAGELGGMGATDWTLGCTALACAQQGHLYCFQR